MSSKSGAETAKIGIESGKFGGGINKDAVIAKRPDDAKGALRRMISDVLPHRAQVLFAMLMVLISVLCSIASPRIIGVAVDKYLASGVEREFAVCCGLLFAAYVFEALMSWGQAAIMHKVSQSVVTGLRKRAFSKLNRLPLSYIDSHSSGEILSRVINDVDSVSTALSTGVSQLLQSAVTVVVTMVIMLMLSPVLTVAGLILLPVRAMIIKAVLKRSKKAFSARQAALGSLNAYSEEIITGHSSIRAFGMEKAAEREFGKLNSVLRSAGEKAEWMGGMTGSIAGCLTSVSYALVAICGCLLILGGKGMTIGIISSMLIYTKQCSRPLNEIANQFNLIMAALAGVERIYALLDEPEEQDSADASEQRTASENLCNSAAKDIVFENVTFGYKAGEPVLKGVDLTIPAGTSLAIVGQTGCGKTTMMNLIERFYEPDSGRILYAGSQISNIPRSEIRGIVGMVLQDPYIFSGTIRENILLGRPGADDDEVYKAAELANAHDFISRLPDGYDTMLKGGAESLSQGQRQMIAIARVFLKDPEVLILDEATSGVDISTELRIRSAIERLMSGRTCIIIAHRWSTIKRSDRIAVLSDGKISESGTAKELSETGTIFRSLFGDQLKVS